jgi:hypothetical protein
MSIKELGHNFSLGINLLYLLFGIWDLINIGWLKLPK